MLFLLKGYPLFFAWGVDSTLKTLADLAVKKLEIAKPLGVLKEVLSIIMRDLT
jgi:hypothetical protein